MIEIKDGNKKTVLKVSSAWIGQELVFDQIVDMVYNDDDPYSGMSPNEEYLLDKQDINYCINVCKRMMNDEDEDLERNEETPKVLDVLQNIGEKCYIEWIR